MKIGSFGKRLLALIAILFVPVGIFQWISYPDSPHTIGAWVAIVVTAILVLLISLERKK